MHCRHRDMHVMGTDTMSHKRAKRLHTEEWYVEVHKTASIMQNKSRLFKNVYTAYFTKGARSCSPRKRVRCAENRKHLAE